MSEELKPAAVHDANVFLPGSLGPVRREVVLAYEHDRVVDQLRTELAALKAGQGVAVAPYGYLREVDGNVQLSIGALRPADRSGGIATPWAAIFAAPPASADAVSVPVALMELEWLEGWLRFAAEPIGQECCGRGGQECCGCPDPVYPCLEDVGRAMDERAKELRALLAQSESKGVKS